MVAKHAGNSDGPRPPGGPQSPFLDAEEAAQYLRITLRALESFRVKGDGPSYRKHGARVLYHLADLDDWSMRRRFRSSSDKDDR